MTLQPIKSITFELTVIIIVLNRLKSKKMQIGFAQLHNTFLTVLTLKIQSLFVT